MANIEIDASYLDDHTILTDDGEIIDLNKWSQLEDYLKNKWYSKSDIDELKNELGGGDPPPEPPEPPIPPEPPEPPKNIKAHTGDIVIDSNTNTPYVYNGKSFEEVKPGYTHTTSDGITYEWDGKQYAIKD